MHNALSFPRLHGEKSHIVAFYAPDGYAPLAEINPPKPQEEVKKTTESTEKKPPRPAPRSANMHPDVCVCVPNPKGPLFTSMGQSDRWNRLWLLPEEALYLIERGSLDIRWPSLSDSAASGKEELSIPMSLQAAYASFIGRGGLTLERFSVYTGLKRLGYTLARAPGWYNEAEQGLEQEKKDTPDAENTTPSKTRGPGLAGILGSLFNWIHDPHSTASTSTGPVIGTGIHRHYIDVYRKLAIIPWYDPVTATPSHPSDTTPPFRVVFHVWKPSTPWKKSAQPPPDFRLAVLSTREQTTMPTMSQLGALLESTPLNPPSGEKMKRLMYMRLRHGYRNVVLAVVDQGVVSYLRFADSAFGKEKLYENQSEPRRAKWSRGNQKSKRR